MSSCLALKKRHHHLLKLIFLNFETVKWHGYQLHDFLVIFLQKASDCHIFFEHIRRFFFFADRTVKQVYDRDLPLIRFSISTKITLDIFPALFIASGFCIIYCSMLIVATTMRLVLYPNFILDKNSEKIMIHLCPRVVT